MGFSSEDRGVGTINRGDSSSGVLKTSEPSLGNNLLKYLGSRYPVAGGIANMAFGPPEPQQIPQMMQPKLPDNSEESGMMGANPRKSPSDGLATILKFFA